MTEKELLDYMYGIAQNILDTAQRNGYNPESLDVRIVPESPFYNGKDMIRVEFINGNKSYQMYTHPTSDRAEYMTFTIDRRGDWHID